MLLRLRDVTIVRIPFTALQEGSAAPRSFDPSSLFTVTGEIKRIIHSAARLPLKSQSSRLALAGLKLIEESSKATLEFACLTCK